MKNNIKRILSVMMALAVLFSLSVSAFAASTPEATIDYTKKGSNPLKKSAVYSEKGQDMV